MFNIRSMYWILICNRRLFSSITIECLFALCFSYSIFTVLRFLAFYSQFAYSRLINFLCQNQIFRQNIFIGLMLSKFTSG